MSRAAQVTPKRQVHLWDEVTHESASGRNLNAWRLRVLVEMFKAHLVMIQRKSANPYARETKKGPRPGGAVKAPAFSSQLHLNSDCYTQPRATSIASTLIPTAYKRRQENLVGSETSTGSTQQP